ncbi:unnamed protein product [Albugo candida]|uniref:Uncharacterized protein n=1 Tax=Albugo candida TaxID=65357 RepID=A0A024FZN6_9STRA|nr:unnamed protein product [Albugo candida]|eukprot:CCI39773.1 unnamed protein product [Albugo candida]
MKVDALSPADEDLEPSEWEFVLEATTPCDLFEPVLKSEDDAEDWLSSLHQNDLEVSGLEFIGSPCITTPDLDRFISPRDENADPWRYVEVGSHTRRKMTRIVRSKGVYADPVQEIFVNVTVVANDAHSKHVIEVIREAASASPMGVENAAQYLNVVMLRNREVYVRVMVGESDAPSRIATKAVKAENFADFILIPYLGTRA